MIDKICTSRSAVFFSVNRPITRSFIEDIFRVVSKDKEGNYISKIIQQQYNNPITAKISFTLFKFSDEPSFLVNSALSETKYAFLMLVEYNNYIVLFRKHISGADKILEEKCSKLDFEQINGLFCENDPSYEKMSISHMGISKAAILRKTYESNDLKGQLSSQATRRSIPNTTTVRTKEHRHVLRPHNSSISKTDSRSTITDLLKWIGYICTELDKGLRTNDFLNSFAQPVKFENIRNQVKPTALLLNTTEIKEVLETDGQILLGGRPVSSGRLHYILNLLENTFYIEPNDNDLNIVFEHANGKKIIVGNLKLNKKSITIESIWLRYLSLFHPERGMIDLQKLINSNQDFLVTFDSLEYIYKSRRVFRDRGIALHCNEIAAALTKKDFNNVYSEKGSISQTSTRFNANSIFGYLEDNLHTPESLLICDDLGDEWADYIELSQNPARVRFLHCKFSRKSTSASQLQEVVAQALKNIGRTSFSKDEITKKVKSWENLYSKSKIKRVRSQHTQIQIDTIISNIIQSPHSEKEIALVVPYISKNELETAFKEIEQGRPVRNHIPQLIWLLSTFISACKENGIRPIIYSS